MHTAEYHGFARRFHTRWRHLTVTWAWPVLTSLCLHAIFLWSSPVAVTAAAPAVARVDARLHTQTQLPLPPLATPTPVPSVPRPLPTTPPAVAASQAVSASVAPLPPSVDVAGVDAGAVRIYRIALSRALASGPLRSGLDAGVRGTMELGVVLGRVTPEVRVLRSSGDASLDAHVLACVRAAVSVATLPSPLQGRVATLNLPIEISDETPAAAITAAVAGR